MLSVNGIPEKNPESTGISGMVYFAVGALRAATHAAERDCGWAGARPPACSLKHRDCFCDVASGRYSDKDQPRVFRPGSCSMQVWILDQIFGTFYVHVPIRATILKAWLRCQSSLVERLSGMSIPAMLVPSRWWCRWHRVCWSMLLWRPPRNASASRTHSGCIHFMLRNLASALFPYTGMIRALEQEHGPVRPLFAESAIIEMTWPPSWLALALGQLPECAAFTELSAQGGFCCLPKPSSTRYDLNVRMARLNCSLIGSFCQNVRLRVRS